MRGLREERIASRRRIRVVRGRVGHMERVLARQRWLRLWLCRRWVARIRVGGSGSGSGSGRRLVVWVVDQMAIWRARERRCGLAGVHGAVCQLGSSSTGQTSKSQTAHTVWNAGSESGLQSTLHGKATGTGTGTSKHGFVVTAGEGDTSTPRGREDGETKTSEPQRTGCEKEKATHASSRDHTS